MRDEFLLCLINKFKGGKNMMKYPAKIDIGQNLWKDIGINILRWADSNFLFGTGQLSKDIISTILQNIKKERAPIDWQFAKPDFYYAQPSLIWVMDSNGRRSFLPQVMLVDPNTITNESEIKIDRNTMPFKPKMPINDGYEFYQRNADGKVKKMFFDGQDARLFDWLSEKKTLVFQKSFYFDYLKTNLSLDAYVPNFGTLREFITKDGKIEVLQSSILANATGINGLVFSNDGFMIIQERRKNVLVRPGELCSGFSGTVDWIDIENATNTGGTLDRLDSPREMVEELGIHRDEIKARRFLGITRELIRGGTPEMFYSVDIDLSAEDILGRIPQTLEGYPHNVYFGPFASSSIVEKEFVKRLPKHFWSLIMTTQKSFRGSISIPFLTNLVLWYYLACPNCVGIADNPYKEMKIINSNKSAR